MGCHGMKEELAPLFDGGGGGGGGGAPALFETTGGRPGAFHGIGHPDPGTDFAFVPGRPPLKTSALDLRTPCWDGLLPLELPRAASLAPVFIDSNPGG